jgi:hypothetical protein
MTTVAPGTPYQRRTPVTVIDYQRGSHAMVMFIITEAMLFLMFFFAYYYLAHDAPKWPTELPKLTKAFIMLAILLASSGVLYVGEEASKKGEFGRAKLWTLLTVIMGLVFLGVQRVRRAPEDAAAHRQRLRLDLLHHHQLSRRAPDPRAADAGLRADPAGAAARQGREAAASQPAQRGALLALRRRRLAVHRVAALRGAALHGTVMSAGHRRSEVSTVHPADIPPTRLWAGVLLAPAAWIAQGSLGWYFGYQACVGLTVGGARVALVVLSLVTLAIALAGWWIAWSSWGLTVPERHLFDIKARDRVEYMAAGGVLVSSIFALAIVWGGLSPLFLNECGGMR